MINTMSNYRVDPCSVKTIETEKGAKGGQGVVVVGTIVPLEDVATWAPDQLPARLLELKFAIKKLNWNVKDPEVSAKLFKV